MIELYTKNDCVFCTKAKDALNRLKVEYKTYTLDKDFSRDFIIEKFPQAKTYPIIVINERFIGGYDQLNTVISEYKENIGKLFLTG